MASNKYDLEILIRTKKQGDDIPKTEKEVENLGKRLNGTLDVLNKSAVAAAAAGATFVKAFQLSREGAEINQLRESFELMNEEVFKTPDLLDKMTSAVNGTIAETDLMKSLLTLTAGASNEAAQSYAAAIPQLLEIAKASNKLNPALGSTTELFDSLALGIKRGSPLILDNLGLTIKIEEANKNYAEQLGKTVAQLTSEEKQMALLNATLGAGDQLIQQVGGNVASSVDSWARLEVQVQESKEALQTWLADGLLPVIETISNGYGDQVETIISGNVEAAKSFDDLVAEGRKIAEVGDLYGGLGAAITGTEKEVIEGSRSTIEAMAAQADSFEQFSAGLDEAFGDSRMRSLFNVYLQQIGQSEQSFYEMTHALAEAERTTAGADEVMLRYANSTQQAAQNAQDLAAGTVGADAALLQNYGNLQKVEQGWQDLADAQQLAADLALVDPFNAAAEPINELLSAQQALADSEGEWVQRTVSTAGQLTAVNAQLASDLSDEQAKAYREILRTVDEGSAEWLSAYDALQNDLTQSQRDALVAQQADLANQPDRLVDVYTGDSEAAEEAQARITAANEAIKQSYRETAAEAILARGGVTQANLDMLVGIGYLTQEQADARLEFANTTKEINELAASFKDTTLTADEQTAAMNALIEGTASTAEQAINLATQQTAVNDALNAMPKAVVSTVTIRGLDEAGTRIGDIMRQLDALDGRSVSANVNVNTSTSQDLGNGGGGKEAPKKAAGGSVFAGGLYQVGEGNAPELLRTPRGLYMIPGDDGQVFSNQQSRGMLGGTYVDRSQTIIYNQNQEAAAMTQALINERRKQRRNQYMGVF